MSTDSNPNEDPRREDLQLARKANGGDPAAWREIYDQTCQPLFNFLCYQTGDRDAARDLMQETYITALDRLDSYQGRGTLLSWLRAVALRKCLDWRRRVSSRMRRLAAFAREQSPLAAPPAQETFPGLSDEIQAALDRLSPRQRAALLLRELEDLSFAEIAESLGCGEPTARVHHHRACGNLRKLLVEDNNLIFGADAGGMLS